MLKSGKVEHYSLPALYRFDLQFKSILAPSGAQGVTISV